MHEFENYNNVHSAPLGSPTMRIKRRTVIWCHEYYIATFAVESVVHGYYIIYKDVWIAAVGEEST